MRKRITLCGQKQRKTKEVNDGSQKRNERPAERLVNKIGGAR